MCTNYLHIPRHWQYPQVIMTWWICVLIFDVVILKQFYFLPVIVFLDISLIFPRNASFLCALCGKVTALFYFAPKYMVKNPLWKRQVCPEFINVMSENNLSHKSGAKSTLCNVAMKDFPLSSYICIRTWPFCFAMMWCPSATSMYLSVSFNLCTMWWFYCVSLLCSKVHRAKPFVKKTIMSWIK